MEENTELELCPSFSCYSSNTAETAARVSIQFQQEEKEHDFEFPPNDDDDVVSDHKTVFPVFNRDLLTHVAFDGPSIDTCNDSLQSLFITEREREPEHEEYVSSSSSSSESEEEEGSGMFCVWRNYKTGAGSSSSPSPLSKCKKSSSTGSGSKRWRIRDFLMRSNSEGKEPMMLITDNNSNSNNKVNQIMKEKRNSGEVAGKAKAQSVHELFYVQQRAKREDGKRKSYLPYRQGLVGFFSNVNGKGNKFPF